MDPHAFLAQTNDETRERFVAEKTLLSFSDYLSQVAADPVRQTRDAARYLRDCFDHYGSERVTFPYGTFTHFKLFDAPFDGGRDRVVGHAPVQEAIYGHLTDFVRAGRVNKLILLHGPNGSAKSSLISCIMRGLEDYSHAPEGAMYTFNWVFPNGKLERTNIGFGGQRALDNLDSYAHLPERDVDARLRIETRDHPLLLLPRPARMKLLADLLGPGVRPPKSLTEGELSAKARQIFEALLRAYQGDLGQVLKHVQVERFFVSRRYRQAAVTVDPQMRADAGVRQVTADRSLGALPPSLQNQTLYEPIGDLVDANRGVVEYNDLLKRPLEAFKYLLSACEQGIVRLDMMTLYLDAVLLGSCNVGQLEGFQTMPDFASFKARIELVQVPYQTDFKIEQTIYAEQATSLGAGLDTVDKPIAPHTAAVAALWAVLTRLRRPLTAELAPALKKAFGKLTPLQKARLYAEGATPKAMSRDVANALRGHLPTLFADHRVSSEYEGRTGASPREIQGVLMGAARRRAHACLSPSAVFDELRELCKQDQVYAFLRETSDGPYQQPSKFINAVKDWYLDRVEDELHQAMGLVDRGATGTLFESYVDHVVHHIRKEKRHNPVTGQYEAADERLMRDVEARLGIEDRDADDFRAGVMHRIGAWRMDNPESPLDYGVIFTDRIARLNDSFYAEKRRVAYQIRQELLTLLVEGADRLDAEAVERAEATLAVLTGELGYDRISAVEVIGFLLKERPVPGA
ncbi:MAG: serine protein kinase [Bradymonadia bacterium]|jgi:serine protein kinase